MTLLEVLQRSTTWLEGRGVETPRLDAELLVAHALGLGRLDLYLQFERPLEPAELDRIRAAVRRRGDLEPVAYITGEREFFSLAFHVGPGVLVPRPETEHLVEVARELIAPLEAPLLADVGTGSGCVAVALLVELPRARAHATDRSRRALETARRNAERHGVLDRLALHEGDVLAPLEGGPAWGHLDLVVSNPPYVRRDDPAVDEGVRRHEPPEALFVSGGDPLEVARRVAAQAARALAPGGALALEVGAGSAAEATALLEAAGWAEIGVVPDLGGHDRIVHARQPA